MLPGFATDFAYAARLESGTVEACVFNLHGQGTSSHFSYLARNIEMFFSTGVSPYPGKSLSLSLSLTFLSCPTLYDPFSFFIPIVGCLTGAVCCLLMPDCDR